MVGNDTIMVSVVSPSVTTMVGCYSASLLTCCRTARVSPQYRDHRCVLGGGGWCLDEASARRTEDRGCQGFRVERRRVVCQKPGEDRRGDTVGQRQDMDTDLLSAEMEMSEPPGMVVNDDNFVYAAAKVFNIIAPYIDHTDASRVFSEVSAALRRAQEASAEATVLLQASEKAQRRERELRALDANRHMSRLRELQVLLEARLERDAAGKAKRQFIRRRLAAETERALDLEHRLAESEAEKHRLEKALEEVRQEKRALSESRKSLKKEVAAAKEAIFQESKVKVEESTMRRMRSLSSELSQLRRKIRDLQAENERLKKTLHPWPASTSLNRANDSKDAVASLLGVSRPGEAGSKQGGENEVSNRWHAAAVGHHSQIDRDRGALGGIQEKSMPSSQAMAGSSQRQGKDGDVSPPPPVPNRWWSFFDRTSRNKICNESVPSQSRCHSARVSDEGLYRQGETARGSAEAVLRAPTGTKGVSGVMPDAPRAVRRYSGVGDMCIKRVGESGGSRRRGLGELPRPSSFRLASSRMIEFAEEDDSGVDEVMVKGTSIGEKKRCDVTLTKNLTVGVRAVDVTAKTSGGSNGLQKVSLGGNSTALSLRDLMTSGEFYPGGVTRLEEVSERATASGVALGVASEDSRSGDIGLMGHNRKTLRNFEYAGVLEGTQREPGHGLSDFPWGKEHGVKKSSIIAPTQPDMESGRWCDIPVDSRCYHYMPSMPHKAFSDNKSSIDQKLVSSFVGVPEGHERSQQGHERSEQGALRSPKRSVSAPVGVLGGEEREASDCRGTDRQECLDDFLQKLSVVTGGDVAAGGGRHGRLSELGVGKDRGVDCETGDDRADVVVRV